jgi:hypothetical protein
MGVAVVVGLLVINSILLSFPGEPKIKRLRFLASAACSFGLFAALCVMLYRFIVDDAFICLRYGRDLADGFGLVFSTDGSPRIEGCTTFLWTVLAAVPFKLGLSDDGASHFMKAAGIVFGAGVIGLVGWAGSLAGGSARRGLLAMFAAATVPYLALWSVGGLESTMYLFWLALAVCLYLREAMAHRIRLASFAVLALAAMTRPEGAFLTMGLVVWDIGEILVGWRLGGRAEAAARTKRFLPGLAAFLVIFGAYYAWRLSYYGYAFPNSFYAKKGTLVMADLIRRGTEILPFLFYVTPLVLLIALRSISSPRWLVGRASLCLALGLTACVGFAFVARREWMPGFRYELPILPFLLPLAVVAGADVVRRLVAGEMAGENPAPRGKRPAPPGGRRHSAEAAAPAAGGKAVAVALLVFGLWGLAPMAQIQTNVQAEDWLGRGHIAVGKWMARWSPPGASLACADVGAMPYYSRLARVYDTHWEGLLDLETAHGKYDFWRFVRKEPTFIVTTVDGDPNAPYKQAQFTNVYTPVFAAAFRSDYILVVWARKDIRFAPEAMTEARKIQANSLTAFRSSRK